MDLGRERGHRVGASEIIHGLGASVNRAGKRQLILDCRYFDLFLRCIESCDERLSDVKIYIQWQIGEHVPPDVKRNAQVGHCIISMASA